MSTGEAPARRAGRPRRAPPAQGNSTPDNLSVSAKKTSIPRPKPLNRSLVARCPAGLSAQRLSASSPPSHSCGHGAGLPARAERRSERPARDHRHAARRRARVVRRAGADAEPRSARRRRRALHVRARARGRDAPVAHVHPHRPAAVRAWHARQQRVSRQGRHRRRSPRGSRRRALPRAPSLADFRSRSASG